jgi:hypothetical protein
MPFGHRRAKMEQETVFALDNGRKVELRGLYFYETYSSLLCGDPKRFSAEYLASLPEMVARVMGSADALLVLKPDAEQLPAYTFIGWFESHDPPWVEPGSTMKMYSWLNVCWFGDSLREPLGELVRRAVRSIDWNTNARGCSS